MAAVINNYSDGFSFTGVSGSGTLGPYTVLGGLYAVGFADSAWGGTVTIETIMPDGSTGVAVLAAFSANGTSTVYLQQGSIEIVYTSTTALQGYISHIPLDRK